MSQELHVTDSAEVAHVPGARCLAGRHVARVWAADMTGAAPAGCGLTRGTCGRAVREAVSGSAPRRG